MSIKLGLRWFNKSNCPRPGNPDNPQPLSPAEKFAGLLFIFCYSNLYLQNEARQNVVSLPALHATISKHENPNLKHVDIH
jgi:hypothetical protein